jgi:hypothetical protein
MARTHEKCVKRSSVRSSAPVKRRVTFADARAPDFGRRSRFVSNERNKPIPFVKFLNNLIACRHRSFQPPVPVWVAEIDLLDPIRPELNGARYALQVFVGEARLC